MACGSLRPGGWGGLGGEGRAAAGGRWPAWWSPVRPLGEAAEGDLSGLDASAGGRQVGHGGVGGLGGVGPAGCWASPGPLPALPCRRGLGAGRLAALACGCALPTVIRVWATGSGGGANPPAGGPCSRGEARHTRQCPGDQDGPARSRAGKCALQPHRSCSIAHRCFPPTYAQTTHPRVHQPGRAGLARPRRYPPTPSPGPATPERERLHPRRAPTANHRTSYTGREISSTLREAQAPIKKLAPHPHPKPPHPHQGASQLRRVPLRGVALEALKAMPTRVDTPLQFPGAGGGYLNLRNFRNRQ